VAINRAETERLVVLDFMSRNQLFAALHQRLLRPVFNGMVTCQLTDTKYLIVDGLLEITLDGLSAVWLKIA